jgi:hypothetical protein
MSTVHKKSYSVLMFFKLKILMSSPSHKFRQQNHRGVFINSQCNEELFEKKCEFCELERIIFEEVRVSLRV